MSKATPVIVGLGLAGVLALVLIKRAEAAPEEITPPEEVTPVVVMPAAPGVDELVRQISQAESLAALNVYYQLISEKFINREVSYLEYKRLYDAYYARWEELTAAGVTA